MNVLSLEENKSLNIACTIQIEFDDSQILHASKEALIPEEKAMPTNRVATKIKSTNTSILLQFNAFDLVSLRAAVNSYLRWLIGIRSVLTTLPG
ncbi:MAG: KEOPS complex subunit Pcc1 [Candidatus Heimdallarchaeota archaeon]